MSESIVSNPDTEYQALKVIEDLHATGSSVKQAPSQRDFARALDMSVGMTNTIIKRLVSKGWLVINRINGRNLSYALTPEGTREVARRSYRYLRRTIGNVVRWKEAVDQVVLAAKEDGCTRVLLIGDSDLDFIVEHATQRHGLVFVRSAGLSVTAGEGFRSGTLVIFSEQQESDAEACGMYKSILHLRDVIA